MPKQLDVIASHIKDAIKSGGRAIYGGAKSVKDPYVEPVILVDVPEDSLASSALKACERNRKLKACTNNCASICKL